MSTPTAAPHALVSTNSTPAAAHSGGVGQDMTTLASGGHSGRAGGAGAGNEGVQEDGSHQRQTSAHTRLEGAAVSYPSAWHHQTERSAPLPHASLAKQYAEVPGINRHACAGVGGATN